MSMFPSVRALRAPCSSPASSLSVVMAYELPVLCVCELRVTKCYDENAGESHSSLPMLSFSTQPPLNCFPDPMDFVFARLSSLVVLFASHHQVHHSIASHSILPRSSLTIMPRSPLFSSRRWLGSLRPVAEDQLTADIAAPLSSTFLKELLERYAEE
jgi:hypothetical protein